jgi:hypothetical protein
VRITPRAVTGRPVALLLSGLLGAGAALLISCGGSEKLIPVANSEPLQKDFEEVAHAAENAHGSCAATEAAIRKAEADLSSLPTAVDAGLRSRLSQGITKLRSDALELCAQPSTQTTVTTAPHSTTTSTTPTTTTTPPTQTTTAPTPPTATPPSAPGGGTPAKEAEGEEGPAKHDHKGGDGESPGPAGGAAPGGEAGR